MYNLNLLKVRIPQIGYQMLHTVAITTVTETGPSMTHSIWEAGEALWLELVAISAPETQFLNCWCFNIMVDLLLTKLFPPLKFGSGCRFNLLTRLLIYCLAHFDCIVSNSFVSCNFIVPIVHAGCQQWLHKIIQRRGRWLS